MSDTNQQRILLAASDLSKAKAAYRDAITLAHHNGLSTRTIANLVGVSHQTIHNIIRADQTPTT